MKTALALGTFDGVHQGHRAVLALPDDCEKIAVIFAKPPKSEMDNTVKSIMTYSDKCRVLKMLGIDEIVTLDFKRFRDMLPSDFLLYLKKMFSPFMISCGFDYRYGKNAAGNTEQLRVFCNKNDIRFCCKQPVMVDGKIVSSTMIRSYLKEGNLSAANALLSEDFSFTAPVLDGDKRGRTLGFPTINQAYPSELTPLRSGVYATELEIDGSIYKGMTDIGIRPTFRTKKQMSETYIFGFSGDLYGKTLTIKPIRFIRDEQKFESIKALQQQLKQDMALILASF